MDKERSHPLRYTPSLLYLESNCVMKSEEIIHQESVCVTTTTARRRFPFKISGSVIWILMSQEAVKNIQRIELEPNTKSQVQVDLLQNGVKKPWNVPSLIATILIKRKNDNVTDPTSTERLVCGHRFTERCVLTPKHAENDKQVRGDPSRRIKRRNATMISQYQDCHTQL